MKQIILKLEWTPEFDMETEDSSGLLFHKWLPDGKKDAICLINQENIKLYVWCERFGIKDNNGWIKYEYGRKEFDEDFMKRNAKLRSGPLFIELVTNIGDEEKRKIVARHSERHGIFKEENNYEEFGKGVYKLIYDKLSVFVYTLKYRYGQYWIHDFPKWDSRIEPLGNYFNNLRAKCIIDENEYEFVPNQCVVRMEVISLPDEEYLNLLTEDDWKTLNNGNFLKQNNCCELLIKSWQSYNRGELKYAFIEAVTSLELVLGDLLATFKDSGLDLSLQQFFGLPLKVQLGVVVSLILKQLSNETLEFALKAIEIRNKIVHEGYLPKTRDEKFYGKLVEVIRLLLRDDKIKLPRHNVGERIYTCKLKSSSDLTSQGIE